MKVVYDPDSGDVVDKQMGNKINCPVGLSEAWAYWPKDAKTCKVKTVHNGWAELEVTEHLSDGSEYVSVEVITWP